MKCISVRFFYVFLRLKYRTETMFLSKCLIVILCKHSTISHVCHMHCVILITPVCVLKHFAMSRVPETEYMPALCP